MEYAILEQIKRDMEYYLKLDHCIMQFQRFDWLSGYGI